MVFATDEANGVAGRSSVRTAMLDASVTNLKTAIDQLIDNLALLQRDDGALLDQTVRIHTLSPDVLALLSSTAWRVRGGWAAATDYFAGDVVLQGGVVYVCIVTHTSSLFFTDLSAGNWGQVTANGTAATTSFATTTTLAAGNVQAAIEELDGELRPVQSILMRELFNAL